MSVDVRGRARGKSIAPRIDPAHRERQRRERERQCPSDVTGAKQIDCASKHAERFGPGRPDQARQLRSLTPTRACAERVRQAPDARRASPKRRLRRSQMPKDRRDRARQTSRLASRRDHRSTGRAQAQARATDVAAGPRPLRKASLAASSAANSSVPPPIVP